METNDTHTLPPDVRALQDEFPEYVEQLKEKRPWNYVVRSFDNITISVVTAALSETTVLPFFVSQLTTNVQIIGLIPAIGWMGIYVPQVLSGYITHRHSHRKPFIILMAWLERVAILGMLIAAFLAASMPPAVPLALLLFSFGALRVTAALLIPPYEDFYAKHIPQGRGSFFGVQLLLSGVVGLAAAWMVDVQITNFPFPQNFQAVIGIALASALIGMPVLYLMKEVTSPIETTARNFGVYWREMWPLMRSRAGYLQFLALRSLLAVGKMGTPFVALYALERFALEPRYVAIYTGVMLAAQSGSALVWGYLGDRLNHRVLWLINAVLIAVQALVSWLAPSPGWFILVFILLGASFGAEFTAQPLTVYALSPPRETARFVGISNTVLGIALASGPILGGYLIDAYSYQVALAVAAILAGLGVPASLFWLRGRRELAPAS